MISTPPVSSLPYKSVAVALLFCITLGPIGLLYGSFWGGVALIFIGLYIIHTQIFFPLVVLWIVSCIWSVRAVEIYNRKIFKRYISHPVSDA